MKIKNKKYCEFCKNKIEERNFKIHQVGCQKNKNKKFEEECQIKKELDEF